MIEHERKGFDDAIGFLTDPTPDTCEKWDVWHKPPVGVCGCYGCASDLKEVECPCCRYETGFNEAMSNTK